MSDLSFGVPRPGFALLETLGRPAGFLPDMRFGATLSPAAAERTVEIAEPHAPDPLDTAWADGFAAGQAAAQEEAEARAATLAAAREGLALSFVRLDTVLEEELRLRLRDTVTALCEATLAPFAIDADALLSRVTRAAGMLARADDERVIRLHPADIELVAPRLLAEWQVHPDPALERGTVRVESAQGGVEDGPATWRMAIAEALRQA